MTTILAIFCISLAFSLMFTPLAGKLARWGQAMDKPDGTRKTHEKATPRTGGIAIFAAFVLSLAAIVLIKTDVSRLIVPKPQALSILLAGLMIFAVGLWDDYHRLNHRIKFGVQVLAASLVFFSGYRITTLTLLGWQFGSLLSYGLTVFWFLIFINAINLIDGLDGLASGVSFFCCLVMMILTIIKQDYLAASLFAALGGSVLGFLRYNFNPASIFLGDGGSYFLGFAIAAISMTSSVKSQTGAALMIPIVALGVPLFDALLSPLRRFITGKALFKPDQEHIHHRLVKRMGLNTKRAVVFVYVITAGLCGIALVIANFQNEIAGLFLILLGAGAVLFIRKLGYLDYLASDKVIGWLQDIGDVSGITRDRRSFLNLQIGISQSGNPAELWQSVCNVFEKLRFDYAVMCLNHTSERFQTDTCTGTDAPVPVSNRDDIPYYWVRNINEKHFKRCETCMFRVELPLISGSRGDISFGTLWLEKDIRVDPISHYTLRRIEHLRRSMIGVLEKLALCPAGILIPATLKEPEKTQMTILVVDDEISILMMMEEMLTNQHFLVLSAADGPEGLRMITANDRIDLAILDINLPGISGLELCSELKILHSGSKVIAITGYPTQFESKMCHKAGFDGYFTKPFLREAVLEAIQKLTAVS